jgi:16S rRNA (cytosine1402-N4)-methyltransferase
MFPHRSVLYQEIIQALQPQSGGYYVDGTVGAGGHAEGILEASSPDGKLLGLDVDPQALRIADERLERFGERAVLVQSSYIHLLRELGRQGWPAVHGIVLDLGVSSMQLDEGRRGFSFREDAPLDMRFNPEEGLTAADLVNTLSEKELADLIFRYGEERRAYQVARAIVRARPLHTTLALAEVIARQTHSGRPGMHPATRTFQALRIAVNDELGAIEQVLPQAIQALRPRGRLAVISFHSLEDRIVKQFLRREAKDCICEATPYGAPCTCGHTASLRELVRRPIEASAEEIRENPRARSAKLRIAEKR